MDVPPLSIVVPAYQEAERLGPTLARVLGFLREGGRTAEVVVVDDGSTDGTAEVARTFAPAVTLVAYSPNRGKGYAVRQGVLATSGRRVLVSDADLAAPIEEISRLESALPPGGVAIGSRALDERLLGVRQPAYRRLLGRTFNTVLRFLALADIRDTQCGFKLFDGDLARKVFARATVDRFAFDVEILLLARKEGARIAEVPVRWNHVPASRVRVIRDSSRMLFDVLRLRWRHRNR